MPSNIFTNYEYSMHIVGATSSNKGVLTVFQRPNFPSMHISNLHATSEERSLKVPIRKRDVDRRATSRLKMSGKMLRIIPEEEAPEKRAASLFAQFKLVCQITSKFAQYKT
jgi:hypothetical protein